MKKLLKATLLTMVLMISVSITSFASSAPSTYVIEDNCIVDSNGQKYTLFFDATGKVYSLEEALMILNSGHQGDILVSDSTRASVPVVDSVTIKTITKNYYGAVQKLTVNAASEVSAMVYPSVTGSFSTSQKLTIYGAVNHASSVAISNSAVSTGVVKCSLPVNSTMYFKPYYVRATGTYTPDNSTSRSFTAYYPQLTNNGYANGLFYVTD